MEGINANESHYSNEEKRYIRIGIHYVSEVDIEKYPSDAISTHDQKEDKRKERKKKG